MKEEEKIEALKESLLDLMPRCCAMDCNELASYEEYDYEGAGWWLCEKHSEGKPLSEKLVKAIMTLEEV